LTSNELKQLATSLSERSKRELNSISETIELKSNAVLSRLDSQTESLLQKVQSHYESLTSSLTTSLSQSQSEIQRLNKELKASLIQQQQALSEQSKANFKTAARSWTKSALIGLSLFIGISAGSWGLMQWLTHEVTARVDALSYVKAQISQQELTLAELLNKSQGVTLNQNENGTFLLLPPGMTVETGWKVGSREAAKLVKK
jgi:exonuclease VII large subunit